MPRWSSAPYHGCIQFETSDFRPLCDSFRAFDFRVFDSIQHFFDPLSHGFEASEGHFQFVSKCVVARTDQFTAHFDQTNVEGPFQFSGFVGCHFQQHGRRMEPNIAGEKGRGERTIEIKSFRPDGLFGVSSR